MQIKLTLFLFRWLWRENGHANHDFAYYVGIYAAYSSLCPCVVKYQTPIAHRFRNCRVYYFDMLLDNDKVCRKNESGL